MRHQNLRITLLMVAAMIFFTASVANANFLMPVEPQCNYRSLMDVNCVLCETVENFSRDFPMGKGFAPNMEAIYVERQYPYPDEVLSVRIAATTDGGATDQLPKSAQRLWWAELAYTMTSGNNWYTGNGVGTRAGVPMDFFTHEVLTVKNQGNIRYKQYTSVLVPWAVSPEDAAFREGDVPSPNRWCGIDPLKCNSAAYQYPYDADCPWGLACPIYDTYPPNTGENPGNWPAPWCSQADNDCNVPGFPEGGGDLLDFFPSLDPDPTVDYPSVPGSPLIRVNGVPAIDCDLYSGVINEYLETQGLTASDLLSGDKLHPLCASPPDATIKEVYDRFGIYAYKLSPGQGMIRFTDALDMLDVVDATFYSSDMKIWTAKIDMTQAPFSDANEVGGSFDVHAKVYDTCGNMASGAQSPPFPPESGENNEAYVGVYDFYYDQIPTDMDPMKQVKADDRLTQCSATDTLCPPDALSREDHYAAGECNDAGCECCYNECKATYCTYQGAIRPDVSTQCNPIGDNANPPGCGPEHWGERGMAEIREFKMSHSTSNLYLKTTVAGEVQFGCYGGWYPLIGCNQWAFGGGEQASKFHGYTWQMLNPETQGTYYLIVIPAIPVYGAIALFLDINTLLGSAMGDAYDGGELEQFADGSGGCKKPGEDEEEPGDPCEDLGCDPDCTTPECNDCDEDGFLNGTDPCPCEAGGEDSDDGCPVAEPDDGGDPLGPYKCNACTISNSGGDLYVELGIEETVQPADSFHVTPLFLSVHDLDVDWILYYACLQSYNLTGLAQDQGPRINYFMLGDLGRKEIVLQEDYTEPKVPMQLSACLGRCDEPDRTDGFDNDCDLDVVEPVAANAVDEGYNPVATQIELSFQEVVSNNDPQSTDLTDLGGYQIQIARRREGPYEMYYVMCDAAGSTDCYGLTTTEEEDLAGVVHLRDVVSYDEAYDGVNTCSNAENNGIPAELRTRFPNPFDPDATYTGYGFPGEPITCVIDEDCDPTHNGYDDDKDGVTDEGCWESNCIDDTMQLQADGQEYWFRVRAFDLPKPEGATATALINYSLYTEPVGRVILRNTVPPDAPDVVNTYSMAEGSSAKVVWNPNVEHDLGGYMIYRCPANPLDAVKMTLDGTLAAWCADDTNYRQVSQEILDELHGYFVDDGMGYRETGFGTGATATAFVSCPNGVDPATYKNTPGNYIKDDNCNWDEASDDLGVDGLAATGDLGEGDFLPTPGEPHSFEWITCKTLTSSGNLRDDLKLCGNIEDPVTGGWFAANESLFNGEGVAQHLYDVTAHANYDSEIHPPVLFHNGLVDGYKYYYKVVAIDAPYLGDGYNDVSSSDNCDDGLTGYSEGPPPTGCVNPVTDRTCDDKVIAYNWEEGGNCSVVSRKMDVVASDTQPPQKPMSLLANVASSGKAVTLTWETPVEDRTLDHYNVYRALGSERLYACVHGGCSAPPYTAGCACDPNSSTTQCYSGYVCDLPLKICTNPPNYTVEPQTLGCSAVPYNNGCVCNSDADCNSGMTCTYRTSICKLDPDNMPAGYVFKNDERDNDGDGVIDEEPENGLDDDNDGLIDEDVGERSTEEWRMGECPTPEYPYHQEKNEWLQERVTTNYVTDHTIRRDVTYYYRISGVDNAVYDPFDFATGVTDVDPPPPIEGTRSFSIIVTAIDSEAPSSISGACTHATTHLPMPCAERLNASFATSETALPISCANEATLSNTETDMLGNQMSIWWYRSSDEDLTGYYVYRAADESGSGVEPPAGAFEKVNQTIVAQTTSTGATQTLCFKNVDIDNDVNYYYTVTAVDSHGNESYLSEASGPIQAKDTTSNLTPEWGTSGGVSSDVNGLKLVVDWMDHVNNCTGYYSESACDEVQSCYWADECLLFEREKDFDHFLVFKDGNDNDVCDADEVIGGSGTCTSDSDCSGGDTCVDGYCCNGSVACNGSLTDSTFNDTDVVKSSRYYYCVRAVDENGNLSEFSAASFATATDLVPPSVPEGLVATAMSNARVGLGWLIVPEDDVECYVPYVSTSTAVGSFVPISLETGDSGYHTVVNAYSQTVECIVDPYYVDDDPIAGMNYYYKVASVDSFGNEGQQTSYAFVTPQIMDVTAPNDPDEVYMRAGYDSGETTAQKLDELDNDSDGIINDSRLFDGKIEMRWTVVPEPDLDKFNIYRSSPSQVSGCICDDENDPTGDCDGDGIVNKIDGCSCTPTAPNATQYGTYELLVSKNEADVCPTSDGYPVGTSEANVCYYQDTNLCNGSRYWYVIIPEDTTGNAATLDKSKAFAVTPVKSGDNDAPDVPEKPSPDSTASGDAMVVKFEENDMTLEDNMDLQGYIIYRDTSRNGDYLNKVATIDDVSRLNYCTELNASPCYCDEVNADLACILDISVVPNRRYYYKISAFDYNGNESEKSSWQFGKATPDAPDAVDAFTALPRSSDNYSLNIFWDGSEILGDTSVAGFVLARAATDDGNYTVIDPYPDTEVVEVFRTTSLVDTNLTQHVTYWYMILTVDQDGNESSSMKTCGIPGEDIFPPSTPQGLSAVPAAQEVRIEWGENTGTIAGYNVYRATNNSFPMVCNDTAKSYAPTSSGCSASPYGGGCSCSEDSDCAGSLTCSSYSYFEKVSAVTLSSYTDTGLVNGTTYFYCVTAYDAAVSHDVDGCYEGITNESSCSTIKSGTPGGGGSSGRIRVGVSHGWNLVAIPGVERSSAGRLYSSASAGADPAAPSMYRLLDAQTGYETFSFGQTGDLAGIGIWYYSDSDGEQLEYDGDFFDGETFDVALKEGWNLIGNPFDRSVSWHNDNVEVSTDGGSTFISLTDAQDDGVILSTIQWQSAASQYVKLNNGEVIPYLKGFWIRTDRAATLRLKR